MMRKKGVERDLSFRMRRMRRMKKMMMTKMMKIMKIVKEAMMRSKKMKILTVKELDILQTRNLPQLNVLTTLRMQALKINIIVPNQPSVDQNAAPSTKKISDNLS